MRIFSPTEPDSSERRVALVPASVTKLTALGAQVAVEAGLGASVNFSDAKYRAVFTRWRTEVGFPLSVPISTLPTLEAKRPE